MSVEHLPWESLEGPIYYAKTLKPRKKWVTTGGWILSVALIIGGIITPYRVLILFGILYVLTLLMQKDTVVTERGVEIFYQMRITTHYDFWAWNEIIAVTREEKKGSELTALYFARGNRSKRLYFTKKDAAQIMVLARKKNSRAIVGDVKPKEEFVKKNSFQKAAK